MVAICLLGRGVVVLHRVWVRKGHVRRWYLNTDLKEMREGCMLISRQRIWHVQTPRCENCLVCSRSKRREQGEAGEEVGGHRGVGAAQKGPCLGLQGPQPLLCWRDASAGC